jgi:branched-chain amino acid transport system ATP-binding protein
VLNLAGMNVFYGRIHILKDVSFELRKGEILSLVGPNSAGKSTTLNMISRLIPIRSGEIRLEGIRIEGLESHEIVDRGIIQVPEGRRIFPYLTVKENLDMGSYNRRARADRKKALEQVYHLFPRLAERESQLGESLSGGEQQMLAIGRSLMAVPRILMLDEPSLGLAPIVVQKIFEVIQGIKKMQVTVLLVEQNVKKSLSISDRGYVLENGRITMSGIGKKLLEDPHLKRAYLGI